MEPTHSIYSFYFVLQVCSTISRGLEKSQVEEGTVREAQSGQKCIVSAKMRLMHCHMTVVFWAVTASTQEPMVTACPQEFSQLHCLQTC